jgi:tRNA-Thr(GGU) m(6)t(6)A37 methyltransferase TsaA
MIMCLDKNRNGVPILTEEGRLTFIGKVRRVEGAVTSIDVFPEFCEGLRNVTEYSHLIILYWAHRRDKEKERRTLLVYPRRHRRKVETGVFSCRSPSRPNPICFCVVEFLKAEGCTLVIKGLDAELGSPIIDIKPYVPHSDSVPNARVPAWVIEASGT